nr:AarF/ABC1/UbiB kinase family protein [Ktedonobacterales bacterium]
VYEELDYHHEGHNAERFARLTANQWDIRVPAVHWDYTTRRVLALEWVEGIKITRLDLLDKAGVDRNLLARRLANTYFKQVLQLGFFHADPHPGNIFVQPQGESFRLVFVDFGMMGSITSPLKRGLRDCFTGIVWHDAKLLVRGLGDLGFLGAGARPDALEKALEVLLDRFGDLPFGKLRDLDPYELLNEVQSLLYGQPLRLPAHFAFLGRAAAMLVGLATLLSPGFNFLDVAEPFARNLTRSGSLEGVLHFLGVESPGQLGRMLARESIAMARTFSSLPHLAERVLEHVERGDLRVVIGGPDLNAKVRHRIAANALARPVPLWIPLTLAGITLTTIIFRRHSNGD